MFVKKIIIVVVTSLWLLGYTTTSILAKGKHLQFDHVLDLGFETTQAFLQDNDGFLWIGTAGGGLFRHDGYDLKNYGIGQERLLNGNVIKIVADRENPDILWVVTLTEGFTRFDKATGTFTHYTHNPNNPHGLAASSIADIVQDGKDPNIFWIVGDEIFQRFEQDTGTFSANKFASSLPNIPENPEFFNIIEDRENSNILWLAGFGLAKFDKITQTFTVYLHDPDNLKSLGFESNYIGDIEQDKDDPNILWLGYWDGPVLDKFDKTSETFTHYVHDPEDPHSLRDGVVQLIYDDGEGTLWLGGWGDANGLTAFDKHTRTITTYKHVPADLRSLSSDTVVNAAKDRAGILWIMHMTGRIDKYDQHNQNFALYQNNPLTSNSLVNNSVYSIYEDHDGLIWFGTVGGLSKFDRSADTFMNYTHVTDNSESLDSDNILCTYQDSAGDFWVGAYAAPLMKFDRETGLVLERIKLSEGSSIAEIMEDPDTPDILWLGAAYTGFAKFQKSTRSTTYYSFNPDHLEKGVSEADMTEIIHDNRDPIIWLGSWSGGGLNRFDKKTETFIHYLSDPVNPHSLSYNEIGGLYQDTSGTLWIGTRGGGLNKFDKATERFTHYAQEHGVPSVINAILEDTYGRLWLSTNQGIVRFNPKTERVEKQYTQYDGLQGDAFLYESGLKTRDGEMWFGGTNGMNRFHPNKLAKNHYIPPVVLTALTQGGESVNWDNHKIPARLDQIVLNWKNNFFEFEYAALNYTVPEKNQYKYMLEGLDQEWYDAGTNRIGRYSGLSAGEYTLRIIGSNNDGKWNTEGVALHVTVIPPFWRTAWFRYMVIFLVAGIGTGTYHVRIRAIKKQKEKLEILVRERTEELFQAKKRAEEAMYETERRFRVIFNQTFQFIGLANPDGTIRELNQTTLAFFQMDDSQVVGKHLWEIPWFDLPEEQEKIQGAVRKAAEGDFARLETSALAPDGSRLILDFSMKPMWGEFENIYLLILEGRDLTDYRRTQEALLETSKAKERFESELRIAHDIQMEIIPRTFPPFPDRPELDIYAVLEPAKEVGGDLYDFFFVDEKHMYFVIGDVSDKGVPAALFMSAAKTLIKAIATRTFPGPDGKSLIIPRTDSVLAAVNYELSIENDACMFVTAFCGILNTQTGAVCYTNAGHNPPLLLRKGEKPEFIEENVCTIIGVDEESIFTQAAFKLNPGDTLLLYTDGVTEAKNIHDELYEEDRLHAEVSKYQGTAAEELVNTVLEAVQTFATGAPQADDITILALTYLQNGE